MRVTLMEQMDTFTKKPLKSQFVKGGLHFLKQINPTDQKESATSTLHCKFDEETIIYSKRGSRKSWACEGEIEDSGSEEDRRRTKQKKENQKSYQDLVASSC